VRDFADARRQRRGGTAGAAVQREPAVLPERGFGDLKAGRHPGCPCALLRPGLARPRIALRPLWAAVRTGRCILRRLAPGVSSPACGKRKTPRQQSQAKREQNAPKETRAERKKGLPRWEADGRARWERPKALVQARALWRLCSVVTFSLSCPCRAGRFAQCRGTAPPVTTGSSRSFPPRAGCTRSVSAECLVPSRSRVATGRCRCRVGES